MINDDLDDTARLVLLDQRGIPFGLFAREVRPYHPGVGLVELSRVFAKYRGFDGRCAATHSIETGEAL